MRYNIIGKNIDVWDKTKEMVEKKLDRIEKLFPEDTNATITLSLEKLVPHPHHIHPLIAGVDANKNFLAVLLDAFISQFDFSSGLN